MGIPLRLLVIEDSQDDAEPMILALREGGLDPIWERVETADELRSALANGTWDAVLSDYLMPELGAEAALRIVRETQPDLPFIVVSGKIGEDVAVALMRATASDYILKDHLNRLAPTVEREVREAANRRAKRAAERAAIHLAAVVESSEDAIISMTLDATITTWNSAAERLFGWSVADVIGKDILFLVPTDKVEELATQLRQLRTGEPVGYFESVRLHRDGRRIDIAMTISWIRDADSKVIGISKSARDIRQQKLAEAALRESEQRYRELIESLPVLVWVYDATGRPLLHNRRWYDYTGQSPKDIAANLWYEALHSEDAAEAVAVWDRCRMSGDPYSTEYRIRRKDGEYRWFLAQGTPVSRTQGINHWVGICTDIDDRKHAEEELQQMSGLLKSVTEETPDAVLVKDLNGKYLLCNPAAARLKGRSQIEVVGSNTSDFFDKATCERVLERENRVMLIGQTETKEEVLTISGVTRTIHSTIASYRDGTGNVIGTIGISRDISEGKRADELLRLSETRYRRLFEAAQDGILIVDVETRRIQDANPFIAELLGYKVEALRGKELWEIGLFQDIEANKVAFRYLQKSGYIRYDDLPLLSKDGRKIEVEFVSNTYMVGDTRTVHCNIRDITDRKRGVVERSELLTRLTLQIERMPLAYLLCGPDFRYTRWNPAAERMFGYKESEVLGLQPSEVIIPPQSETKVKAIFARLAAGDMDAHVMSENVTKDGRTIFCQWHNTPLFGSDKTFQGILSLAEDVTARQHAEQALRLRDRAIQAATQGLLITDPGQSDDPIIYVSPGFERMTGYNSGEVLGRNCRFLQGKDTDPAAVSRLREAIRTEKPCTVELLNYRKDGTTFWNELSISPVRDDASQLTNFVGVQADITSRRSLEEQFRQVQKMEAVGQLAGGIAHDFNNLLTIINGYSDVLLRSIDATDPSHDLVNEIHKAGERSAGLTRQLLAFSRQQVLAPRILDLNAVVTDTEKMLQRLVGEDVQLTTTLQPSLSNVRADPGQLEQVLMNLLVNARDAMPRGGRITIETHNVDLDEAYVQTHAEARSGPQVLLSVTDTGNGIPPELRAKIFEPFFTTKGPGKGTGLGLATVYGIVKQSGGHIGVYSEVGIGTTFKVYLPRAEMDVPKSGIRPGLSTPQRGSETIMLVEDEDGVRALTRYILTTCGYSVMEAAEGVEAARVSAEHVGPIHLLITDVIMPGAGGRSVAEEMTKLNPAMKTLFVSGYTDDAIIRHGVLRKGVNFLQKPFSPVALATKVREVLDA